MRPPSTTTACLAACPSSPCRPHPFTPCPGVCVTVWLAPVSLLVDLSAGVYEAGTVFLYKTNLSSAAIVEDRYMTPRPRQAAAASWTKWADVVALSLSV